MPLPGRAEENWSAGRLGFRLLEMGGGSRAGGGTDYRLFWAQPRRLALGRTRSDLSVGSRVVPTFIPGNWEEHPALSLMGRRPKVLEMNPTCVEQIQIELLSPEKGVEPVLPRVCVRVGGVSGRKRSASSLRTRNGSPGDS